jgi:hypothetical protein
MKRQQVIVTGVAVLGLAAGLTGCGSSSAGLATSAPSAPSAVPATLQPTYTLSGIVYIDTPAGRVPLDGVQISEQNAQRYIRTGKDGLYSISGLTAGNDSVSVSRWEVVTYTKTLTISGDTRLDIELPTYTLSGVVFERTPTGTAPIDAVDVYCDGCGSPYGHTFSHTGADGVYSFSYTYSGTNPLLILKAGYAASAGSTRPMVNGDTRFDIELVRR